MPRLIIEIPDYIEQDGDWRDIIQDLLDENDIIATVDYTGD